MLSLIFLIRFLKEMQEKAKKIDKELIELIREIVREEIEKRLRIIRIDREEFDELKKAVRELIEAQRETKIALRELSEAQRRTEEAVRRHEDRLTRVEKILEELAEAQRRTEEAVRGHEDRLTRVEKILEELAEAQRRTDGKVEELRLAIESLRADLSISLEELGEELLPPYLKENYGIELKEKLRSEYLKLKDGRVREFDLVGIGERDKKRVLVVIEVKSRISIKELERFRRVVRKIEKPEGIDQIVNVIFSRRMALKVERMAKDYGIIPISGSHL